MYRQLRRNIRSISRETQFFNVLLNSELDRREVEFGAHRSIEEAFPKFWKVSHFALGKEDRPLGPKGDRFSAPNRLRGPVKPFLQSCFSCKSACCEISVAPSRPRPALERRKLKTLATYNLCRACPTTEELHRASLNQKPWGQVDPS